MNKDNFNYKNSTDNSYTDRKDTGKKYSDKKYSDSNSINGQQFRGGFPTPPQFPGRDNNQPPRMGPGRDDNQPPRMGPGMENQPRTAPPNFTPEGPEMGQRSFGAPGQYGEEFGGQAGFDKRRRPSDFRRCMNRFTYIWLFNGNNFWFYPTFVSGQFIQGWRWRRNRWEFDRINIRRIFYFRCF